MDIVLIGGLWLTADVWDATVAKLAQPGHRTRVVDLPSERDAVLDDQLASVLEAVDQAARAPLVVGHSAAATLAWLAADRRPDHVTAVALVGGFPATDGTAYADFFPLVDGHMGFPGWVAFEGPDSADLDQRARDALETSAVPVPGGVAQAQVSYIDDRRFNVPVNLVCPEFTADDARGWIAGGDVPELAKAQSVTYTDIDTGHWPMITAPGTLADALVRIPR